MNVSYENTFIFCRSNLLIATYNCIIASKTCSYNFHPLLCPDSWACFSESCGQEQAYRDMNVSYENTFAFWSALTVSMHNTLRIITDDALHIFIPFCANWLTWVFPIETVEKIIFIAKTAKEQNHENLLKFKLMVSSRFPNFALSRLNQQSLYNQGKISHRKTQNFTEERWKL